MRISKFLALVAIVFATVAQAQDSAKKGDSKPATKVERMSYSIGADIGKNLSQNRVTLSLKHFFAGISDAFSGKKLALTDQELGQGITEFRSAMQEGARKAAAEASENNIKKGKEFLAQNAKKEGVKTTASGLQYKVIRAGKGATPKATDTVVTHYEGRLISGKVFDSSIKRGMPAKFPVNGVIKGWTEALQLMKVGDKWQLFIPSGLAYGARGAGRDIGPNETLIFDIELIKIEQ